jgi:hypothetical protein
LSVTGNIRTGNLNSLGQVSAVSNIIGGNIITAGALSAASVTTTADVLIGGNLTVNGNTEYTNVTSFNVRDPIIGLGRGANDSPLVSNDGKDRGEQLWYYSGAELSAFIGYQNSTGNIIAASNVSIANEVVTVNSYGSFVAGNLFGTTASTTGNIQGGNLRTAGQVSATGNVIGGNVITAAAVSAASVSASGNITSGNLNATGLSLSGNVVSPLVSAANITTSANIAASYFVGNGAALTGLTPNKIFNGTSEANIGTSGGNANISIGGTSNVAVFTTAGLNITGATSASGNVTGGNLNAAGLSLSSNVVVH